METMRGTRARRKEIWQTKIPTIKGRTQFVFNNEVMSDVKFVVAASNDETSRASKRAKMVIPAHKFVLAISSPVFYAMFYGEMAETTDSVELPDCEYESLLELFRYLYTDGAILSGSNVMQVHYLAKKYMVPSLVDECTKYLRKNMEGSNAFTILLHAQKFGKKQLEDRCWEVIKTQATEAVKSDEFVTLERPLVESVVKQERLFVKEVSLFKAVDCWATKEIERQGLTLDGNIKRQVLGEEIVKSIRFPLMSQKEFAGVVPDCNIFTMKEVVDMMKYYSHVLTTPLPFIQSPRSGPLLRYFRFNTGRTSSSSLYQFDGKCDIICFIPSKAIFLHGVQLFGRVDGRYTVDVKVAERIIGDSSLFTQSGICVSKTYKDSRDDLIYYLVFDVLFGHPVCLENGKRYKIILSITGPSAPRYLTSKMTTVECSNVTFTFGYAGAISGNNSDQVAALIFSL